MPAMRSKYFGELNYSSESVFRFEDGIPGFEDQTEFVFLDQPHTNPLVFMQSLHDPGLCFVAVPASVALSGYQPRLSLEDLERLGLSTGDEPQMGRDILCLALATVTEGADPTVNLASPIVLNLLNRKGLQAIQDSPEFSLRHPLLPREEALPCS
jgi:flagellar assembly factor FliW